MKQARIAPLDSLRFFMILNTTFCHITWMTTWVNYALGVDFFYILSGFFMLYVIYHNEDKMNELLSMRGIKNYYLYAYNRNKKIIFWYYLAIFITLPVQFYKLTLWHNIPYAIAGTLLTIIVTPTLLQAAFGVGQASHLGIDQGGFISTLFMIQMGAPFLARVYNKYKKVNTIIKMLMCFFILIIFLVISGYIDKRTLFNDLRYGTPYVRIWYFILGICLCELKERKKRKSSVALSTFFEVSIIILTILWIVLPYMGVILTNNYYLSETINILICMLIVYIFSYQTGLISKILSSRIFVALGRCAMYIYLFHYFFIWLVELWVPEKSKTKHGMWWLLFVIIGTGITTFGAYLYDKRKKEQRNFTEQ